MTPDERAHEIVLQFRRGIIDRWEDLESVIGSAIIAAVEDDRDASARRAEAGFAIARELLSAATFISAIEVRRGPAVAPVWLRERLVDLRDALAPRPPEGE